MEWLRCKIHSALNRFILNCTVSFAQIQVQVLIIILRVRKNGSVEYYTFGMKLTSTVIEADSQMVGTVTLLLNSGDYVEMWAYQDKSSGSQGIRSSRNIFSGCTSRINNEYIKSRQLTRTDNRYR